MSVLVPALAAFGIVLFVSGVTHRHRLGIAARTEPFMVGFRTRVGRLIEPAAPATGFKRALLRVLPPPSGSLEERLRRAGSSLTADGFRLEQVVWAGTAVAAVALLSSVPLLGGASVEPVAVVAATAIAAVTGALARDWFLTRQGSERAQRSLVELPTAMDLVTLAVMSGASVPVALERVGTKLRGGIGDEFLEAVGDMRAGMSATEALERMAVRIDAPAMARFVDALCTAIERGAPLADVLRAQADDQREAKRRTLLESGGKREVMMLVPVVFLIMPVVVIFALLPGLVALDLLVL